MEWILSNKKQLWGNCKQLQDAVSVDVETRRGKLFVLDKGSENCDAKVVVFNLYFNYEVASYVFTGIQRRDLSVIVVDSHVSEQRQFAFVGGLQGEVVVLSLNEMKFWTIKLVQSNGVGPILTDSLAVSKNKPQLFITSTHTDDIYSMSLRDLGKLTDSQVSTYKLCNHIESSHNSLLYLLVKKYTVSLLHEIDWRGQ